MLMAAQDLLQHNRKPAREEIREHLSGNYCRCTGYQAIIDAVENTAREDGAESMSRSASIRKRSRCWTDQFLHRQDVPRPTQTGCAGARNLRQRYGTASDGACRSSDAACACENLSIDAAAAR
jgi:hypothetical protein